MDVGITTVEELYQRLRPALKIKRDELIRNNINYVKCEDIWNYLKNKKWVRAHNLLLYEMVEDIFNCDIYDLQNYVEERIKKESVKADLNI